MDSLKEAVEFCASHAVSGEAVLLSTGLRELGYVPEL